MMKIYTITIHLPFNYGNALQMLALHRYLIKRGHDARVLGLWCRTDRDEICHLHNLWRSSVVGKMKVILLCLTCTGKFCRLMREHKILKWLDRVVKWSDVTGPRANFSFDKLDCDLAIVGSDQVWNPAYKESRIYLLGSVPHEVRKIAYAASLGSAQFPEGEVKYYSDCLRRFSDVSVREQSAVEILRSRLGVDSVHVCDPTLLHSRNEWCDMLGVKPLAALSSGYLVYLVTPDGQDRWRDVVKLAKVLKDKVHVYVYHGDEIRVDFRHPVRMVLGTLIKRVLLFMNGVRLHFSATPSEFVERLANSKGVFTDSFHGLMFSTIFEKPCNVVIGNHAQRKQMSARLLDFMREYGDASAIAEIFDPLSLRQMRISPQLQNFIERSKYWLDKVVEGKR